ncbi:MAG: SIMPL domain-containing protein [Candidatus Baltobacteraceae bacterium]
MKRTLICLLAALAFASGAAPAAQTGGTEITAAGSGSVSLPPDLAIVNAAVETNAPSAEEAVSQNNAIYERIVAAAGKLGVARSDVTLSYYNVNYNPRPAVMPPTPTGERYGYTVSRSFAVKVREIGKAGRVSDALTSSGATAINGVTFGLADQSAARAEATAKAVADARSSAEALARATALHIVGIKSVDLMAGGQLPSPVMMRAAAMPNPPTQFDQSSVSVTVSVSIVFLAEP